MDNKKVLICDDEPYIVELVSYIVKEAGYDILTAEDGEKALCMAKKYIPDLMFLDLLMPKKTGDKVCKELKEDSLTKNIIIIMLTGINQEIEKKQSFEKGADYVIPKPFSPKKLKQKLNELLKDS